MRTMRRTQRPRLLDLGHRHAFAVHRHGRVTRWRVRTRTRVSRQRRLLEQQRKHRQQRQPQAYTSRRVKVPSHVSSVAMWSVRCMRLIRNSSAVAAPADTARCRTNRTRSSRPVSGAAVRRNQRTCKRTGMHRSALFLSPGVHTPGRSACSAIAVQWSCSVRTTVSVRAIVDG